ncbi:hypothetical protein BG006_004448 [Podila minutissima]|uniref:Cytochrome P450 n=1 Tax=Podila minutissima TaxID=64525 RepID=A0A9P5SNN9_9FUNG|nr:hypothetical protein BG006_004448 [Podila minutissima]
MDEATSSLYKPTGGSEKSFVWPQISSLSLTRTNDYPKSEIHEAIELSDQHNLFSSRNNDFHKNRRRLVASAFGNTYPRSLEPLMRECTRVLIRKLDEVLAAPDSVPQATVLPKGQVNICSFLNRLSLDIIGETAAAGSETSSTAMTHILMFFVKTPEKLAKLREEIDMATAGNLKGFLPSLYQVRSLEYLTACINESMRLRTVAATGIPREVSEDATMAGIFVPAGTKFTFYPFSAGTCNCVGKSFAMMRMRLVLAAIITQYYIKDVPGQRTDYVQFITTALATGS